MATKKPSRIQINMAALTEVQQALAHGLLTFGERIARDAAANAAVSTDERYGHVKDQWGVAVYFAGKKVGNASADGSATAKPREFRADKATASGIVGFGFPARFLELGTSDTAAQPFLSPAAQGSASYAQEAIAEGARPHWPRPG